MSSATTLVVSPAPSRPESPLTRAKHEMANSSPVKKYGLLALFTLAQFLDTSSNSMLFPAIPAITSDLNLDGSQSAWLFAAYQATFAAFLLISGRLSDIYSPKPTFIAGNLLLGVMCLGAGFVRNKIGLLIIRAICGIGASLTIPSALNLIVRLFPDPHEQSRAISLFASAGALGNVGGLLIGAILVEFASWHWIFWLITMIAVPIAIACFAFIPTQPKLDPDKRPALDIVGVSSLTVSILLFVYAVTTGSNGHWGTVGVILPLILSILMGTAFFIWEARIDEKDAALPPKLWFYPNFSPLVSVALMPYFYWISLFLLLIPLWQSTYHYSAIMSAVRFLPLGICAGTVSMVAGNLANNFRPKPIILIGVGMTFISSLLLPFADSASRYWSLVFPAFVIGTTGAMLMYTSTSIAMFKVTPPEIAGTVGAVFNAALQLGSSLGEAAVTSIQTSIDKKSPTKLNGYEGRFAAFWFMAAIIGLGFIAVLVFYRSGKTIVDAEAPIVILAGTVEEEKRADGEELDGEKKADVEAVIPV